MFLCIALCTHILIFDGPKKQMIMSYINLSCFSYTMLYACLVLQKCDSEFNMKSICIYVYKSHLHLEGYTNGEDRSVPYLGLSLS